MVKKAVSLILVCVLGLCLLLSGCSGGDNPLGGLSSVFNSNSPTGSGAQGTGEFSIDLSQGEYSEGGEYGYLGDVLHTYWFNYAVDKAFTCKTYGGYTAPDDYLLLVIRMGIKNPYSKSVDMYDDDFLVWWNDDADDAYGWLLTTRTYIGEEEIHVDEPLSDIMFPESYVLGINETRVGELIYQVPALDKDGRENRDFTIAFVEIFDADNEDEQIGDYYFTDFTAESR